MKINWPLMSNNITREDLESLRSYLSEEDPKLTHGPMVRKFESCWSEWLGVNYSVMVNSGASANDLTLLALRYKYGIGEIVVPALTWVSDISAVIRAGFTPRFVDIDPNTLAMNEEEVKRATNSHTKAVFLTHILGFDGLSDNLLNFLEQKKIPLIEDVCESHGASHNGRKLGSIGLVSNFSFYYAHHMTTIEGGMISTNDEGLYEIFRMLRSHGLVRESNSEALREKYASDYPDLNPDFIFAYAGHNMRPNELNAILGLSQLQRLDLNIKKRNINFNKFIDGLDTKFYRTSFVRDGMSNYAFTLVLQSPNFQLRDKVETVLRSKGIEFRRGLSGGGNQIRQPYLQTIVGNLDLSNFPETEHVHHFGWYIGNYPDLSLDSIDSLVAILNSIPS